ncbi:LITAF-like zinc ribbon domain protein (macronuclear) [Tetrahymena thermophila SB210]|uniref:LITAF-like zinc ribbon domain protein n=1 Tax=Tetrahymena thermophila (strain SB210) TaxID=312017 RepID=Q23JM4_TETTS|nr:LITAF-like zinc ribbon domain protein [Tetrahymena thermophila SB210]EAR96719.1 LITAF-like zinc ribbon domain protein [Tetrahymena thermophila SB210]|eukprot:XP_001016964.1 LITAF-like zinc ribbon domain protein [Tetrahymena thermophila SB210]
MQDPQQQQYPYPPQAPLPAMSIKNDNQNYMPAVQMQPIPMQGQQLVNIQIIKLDSTQICQITPHPVQVNCNSCQEKVTTELTYKRGQGTFCCCFLLTIFVGCCCCIPLFNKNCQDKIHSCPKCHNVIGVCEYRPFS